jgi:hypothetical protein
LKFDLTNFIFKNDNRFIKWLVVLAGLSFVFCIYFEQIFHFRYLFHDTLTFLYPWRAFLSDSIRSGYFPLWDSFNSPGIPLSPFAIPNYYPISNLIGIVGPYTENSFLVEMMLTSFIGFLGFFYWLRSYRLTYSLSIAGALAYVGSGPFVTSRQCFSILISIAFQPWLYWGVKKILNEDFDSRGQIKGCLAITVSLWMVLTGGYIGTTYPIMLFLIAFTLIYLFEKPKKVIPILGYNLISALLIVFILMLPLTEFMTDESQFIQQLRIQNTNFNSYQGALPLNSLLTLFLPNGSYISDIVVGRSEQMYFGIILALIIPACFLTMRPQKKEIQFFLLGLFAFFAAMGVNSPIAKLFNDYIPLIKWLRFHCFWSSIANFFFITLSLMLIDRFFDRLKDLGGRKFLFYHIGIICCIIGIISVISIFSIKKDLQTIKVAAFEIFIPTIFFVLGILISIFLWSHLSKHQDFYFYLKLRIKYLAIGVLCVVGIIFLFENLIWLEKISISKFNFLGIEKDLLQNMFGLAQIHELITLKYNIPYGYAFAGDLIHIIWIISVWILLLLILIIKGGNYGRAGLMVLIYLDLMIAGQGYWHGNLYWIGKRISLNEERNVIYNGNDRLVGGKDIPQFFNRRPYINTYTPIYNVKINQLQEKEAGKLVLYRLIWFLPADRKVRMDQWEKEAQEPMNYKIKMGPNYLSVSAETEYPLLVTWTDAWAKGWKAQVNGEEKALIQVENVFKGVRIDKGRSNILFYYKPKYIWFGLISLLIGILGIFYLFYRCISMNEKIYQHKQ